MTTIGLILFLVLAVIAVASALGMLFSSDAVNAALYLILNFMTVAVFYLLLHAPFIAISQVTVYAGAIMVLFLFVIMLLGRAPVHKDGKSWWMQPLPLLLGGVLLSEAVYIVLSQARVLPGFADVSAEYGSPLSAGEVLFTSYLLPFEATSVLLLAAMVGAIVLIKQDKQKQNPPQ